MLVNSELSKRFERGLPELGGGDTWNHMKKGIL